MSASLKSGDLATSWLSWIVFSEVFLWHLLYIFIEVSKTENEMLRMCECSRVWITTLVMKKKRKGFQTTLWEFTNVTKTLIKKHFNYNFTKKYIFAFLVQPNFLYSSVSKNHAKEKATLEMILEFFWPRFVWILMKYYQASLWHHARSIGKRIIFSRWWNTATVLKSKSFYISSAASFLY